MHGITTERAIMEGDDLENVLITFNNLVGQSDFIVAHNISFDEKILRAELLRKGVSGDFEKKRKLCMMQTFYGLLQALRLLWVQMA